MAACRLLCAASHTHVIPEDGKALDELLDILTGALGSRDGMARKKARETLVLVGEPAVLRVQALLASSQKRVRWEAVKTLAAMVDAPSVEVFAQLLNDPISEVRWLAADGLIGLGPRSAAPVLRSLLEKSTSPGHRQMARRVLRRLSADNDVLAEIASPVIEVLDMETLDSGVIATKAERALADLERVTGRLPTITK